MKAYAILDGGGVKGAALAGALSAAADNHIEFQGYVVRRRNSGFTRGRWFRSGRDQKDHAERNNVH